ncbi:hypothetical protein FDP41_008155 [Naegleria fowleri]|uniref:Uncharacterized protein n=1 Tax=Naegleria fowleri TaxID=5763 RepID=A0A6A5BG40_NAEFO|nr:uncharacterized protein FDP41_008155 [Naegleria fowleri]KAF0973451.1 hypothetical protein FDP41_008155 [Naegleria fowleri]
MLASSTSKNRYRTHKRPTRTSDHLSIGVEGVAFGSIKMKQNRKIKPSTLSTTNAQLHSISSQDFFQRNENLESVQSSRTFREENSRKEEEPHSTESSLQLHVDDQSSIVNLNSCDLDVSRISSHVKEDSFSSPFLNLDFEDSIMYSTRTILPPPSPRSSSQQLIPNTAEPSMMNGIIDSMTTTTNHASNPSIHFPTSSTITVCSKNLLQQEYSSSNPATISKERTTPQKKGHSLKKKTSKPPITPPPQQLSKLESSFHANSSPLKKLELYCNNEKYIYNDFDFVLASEEYISSENEKTCPIPKWNKITQNIPLTFIDDLHSEYILQPLERTQHSLNEDEHGSPLKSRNSNTDSKSFFLTDHCMNEQDHEDTFEYKESEQEDVFPSTNHVLLTKDGVQVYDHSFASNSSPLPPLERSAFAMLPIRPHTSMSFFTSNSRTCKTTCSSPHSRSRDMSSRSMLSKESLLKEDHERRWSPSSPPPPYLTSNNNKMDEWNLYPSRSKIILEHLIHTKPIVRTTSTTTANNNNNNNNNTGIRTHDRISNTSRSSSSQRSRPLSMMTSSMDWKAQQEEDRIEVRLPDQSLLSATSKPLINRSIL